MSEINSNKAAVESKKAPVKKVAADGSQLFVSPAVSAVFWTVSLVLVCAIIFGNYYYTNFVVVEETTISRLLRVLAVIFGLIIALSVSLLTNKGRALIQFSRQAYTELKKVIWPTRQEAVQTTVFVFVAVSVVSLFLYLCDIVFLQIVRVFTL